MVLFYSSLYWEKINKELENSSLSTSVRMYVKTP